MLTLGVELAERGLAPDWAIRWAIRRICAERLRDEARAPSAGRFELSDGHALAAVPDKANDQHYEVPAAFFEQVLGPHLKYSCGLWEAPNDSLEASEERMLALTCERAGIVDGMRILELGCGWGSLSRFMAERYPNSQVLAISNSSTQRAHILRNAPENLEVRTVDVNDLDFSDLERSRRFDRIVSVEMFEHVRRHDALLDRIANWLTDDGRLFVHIFCHARYAYPYEDDGESDWMARYFFSGGVMPSFDLLVDATDALALEERWRVDGLNYHRTCEAWLSALDARADRVMPILRKGYGEGEARRWFFRWRLFFLACSELFRYRDGQEWFVGHYLFKKNLVS